MIAFLALAVSVISIWLQFRPKQAEIELLSNKRPSGHQSVNIKPNSFSEREDRLSYFASGLEWNLTFYNPTDRPVVLEGISIYYYDQAGKKLKDVLGSSLDDSQDNPVLVKPREFLSLDVRTSIPIAEPPKKCLLSKNLDSLTVCFIKEDGIDLFGNRVNFSEVNNYLFLNWPNVNDALNLRIDLFSADGTHFSFPIHYDQSWIISSAGSNS